MVRKQKIESNKDLYQEALKYKTPAEFYSKNKKAFNLIAKKRIFSKACKHLLKPYLKMERYQDCQKRANKCKFRTEFKKKHFQHYNWALIHKLLPALCEHMDRKVVGLTAEEVFKIANQYKSKSVFYKKAKKIWARAGELNIRHEVMAHMTVRSEDCQTRCIKNAKKCKTTGEFKRKYPSDYRWLLKYKKLWKYCSHLVDSRIIWTKDKIKKIAKKYKNKGKCQKENPGLFGAAMKMGIWKQVSKHMTESQDNIKNRKYKRYQRCLKLAQNFKYRRDFIKKYESDYYWLIGRKWLAKFYKESGLKKLPKKNKIKIRRKILNKKKVKNKITKPLTFKQCLNILKGCRTRSEFYRNKAYDHSLKQGFLQELLKHKPLTTSRPRRRKHSYEQCLIIMRECETSQEFKTKYKNHYCWLVTNGLIKQAKKDRAFETPDKGSSTGEKTFLVYINALLGINLEKDTKVDWLISKHGRRMSLDGYDPIAKIAFEFQGYMHKLSKVKRIDQYKKRQCRKHGIVLITITDYYLSDFYHHVEPLQKQLFRVLKKLNIQIKNPQAEFKIIYNGCKYTEKAIKEAVSQCTTLKEFRKKYSAMYAYLGRRKMNDYYSGLSRRPPENKYSEEFIWNKVKECGSYKEFRTKYQNTIHQKAGKMGLLEEIKKYLPPTIINRKKQKSERKIKTTPKASAPKKVTAKKATAKTAALKKVNSKKKIKLKKLDKISKVIPKTKTIKVYSYEDSLAKMKLCETTNEFLTKYKNEYQHLGRTKQLKKAYKERNFTKKHKRIITKPKLRTIIPDDVINAAIADCKVYSDFSKKYNDLYNYLRFNGQLKRIQNTLPKTRKKRSQYTKEKIFELVKTCNSYIEFIKTYGTAYNESRFLNIRDEIKEYFSQIQDHSSL